MGAKNFRIPSMEVNQPEATRNRKIHMLKVNTKNIRMTTAAVKFSGFILVNFEDTQITIQIFKIKCEHKVAIKKVLKKCRHKNGLPKGNFQIFQNNFSVYNI